MHINKKNIVVYGFYNHKNLGDELFKEAFKKLFPNYDFCFVDHLTLENLNYSDTIFFGGGSFLNQDLSVPKDKLAVWIELRKKNILYIGIGLETEIHKSHNALMQQAKLIAYRKFNNNQYTYNNIIEIPDLVYTLNHYIDFSKTTIQNSVLVLPNVSVVPRHNDPHWMHSAWEHFKTEMAQFLDYLIDNKYNVQFGNMCHDPKLNDNFATYSILSGMINRNNDSINNYLDQRFIATFGMVITQRYHGIILADMNNVPSLSIHHHDKLKTENSISYYEISKDKLIFNFNSIKDKPKENKKTVDFSAFNQLVEKVNDIIKD